MVAFNIGQIVHSEFLHLVSLFAAIRVWFHKEITAGKAFLAEAEAKAKADVKKIEADIKKI